MRTAWTILIIALLLSLAGNIWFLWDKRQAQKQLFENNDRLNEVITSKQGEISKSDSLVNALQSKVLKDSLNYLRSTTGLKQVNSRLALKIAAIRPLIAPDLAANDTLNAFVSLTDSLLVGKDSLIRSQEIFCQLQVRDLSKIIELQEQKFEAQKQITASVTEQLADETREHRKTKRRSALKSVGLGILSAGIIYISIRE